MSDRLELSNPKDLELIADGHGEYPDTYAVTEDGIKEIEEFLNKYNNDEENRKIYNRQ